MINSEKIPTVSSLMKWIDSKNVTISQIGLNSYLLTGILDTKEGIEEIFQLHIEHFWLFSLWNSFDCKLTDGGNFTISKFKEFDEYVLWQEFVFIYLPMKIEQEQIKKKQELIKHTEKFVEALNNL